MRERLARFKDQRISIRALVRRRGSFSRVSGQKFPTILLANVQLHDGTPLADHVWIFETRALRELALQPGDLLACSARVRVYTKGYIGHAHYAEKPPGTDYSFEHLEACVCLRRAKDRRETYGQESG